jgi:hypothetical protein
MKALESFIGRFDRRGGLLTHADGLQRFCKRFPAFCKGIEKGGA